MTRQSDKTQWPYIIVSPDGVYWLGHAPDEAVAWQFALGWPSYDEIEAKEEAGWYAARCTVTWNKPEVET